MRHPAWQFAFGTKVRQTTNDTCHTLGRVGSKSTGAPRVRMPAAPFMPAFWQAA